MLASMKGPSEIANILAAAEKSAAQDEMKRNVHALVEAAKSGKKDEVTRLIGTGADVNSQNEVFDVYCLLYIFSHQ